MPRTINKLPLAKALKLADYVKEHWNNVAMTYEMFAKQASAALGFEVSKASVSTSVEALGFSSHRPKAIQTDVIVAYEDLRNRVGALEQQVAFLKKNPAWALSTIGNTKG